MFKTFKKKPCKVRYSLVATLENSHCVLSNLNYIITPNIINGFSLNKRRQCFDLTDFFFL
jgi:hypothetical protein